MIETIYIVIEILLYTVSGKTCAYSVIFSLVGENHNFNNFLKKNEKDIVTIKFQEIGTEEFCVLSHKYHVDLLFSFFFLFSCLERNHKYFSPLT